MRCVDADRNAVERLAKAGDVGDVDGERRVAAEVAMQQMTVDPDRAVCRNAVKAQREGFATAEVPNVVLNTSANISIRIQLKVARVSQAIDVIGGNVDRPRRRRVR